MRCGKCTGLLLSRWDHELRVNELFCGICAWRPAYKAPAPSPLPSNRGRYQREVSIHSCGCGAPKVPWRSKCRECLVKQLDYARAKQKQEKHRAKNEAKRMFA